MNKIKVMYLVLLCNTYGCLCTSISSVTPMGDRNKYKPSISTTISSVVPTGIFV